MRIRKRQVPLPLSSLSPVPVSDPVFNLSPVVQLHCKHDPHQNLTQQPLTALTFLPQPSDHPNQPIGANNDSFDSPPPPDAAAPQLAQTQNNKDGLVLLRDEDYGGREEGEGEKSSNDTRKKTILGAEASRRGVELSQFSSAHQVAGRWCEEEKAFPLKKRRGSFERKAANNDETEAAIMEKDKKTKTKMKRKMNKTFPALEEENNMTNEAAEAEDNKETTKDMRFDNKTTTSGAKKRGRGGALMEGSRCSRVNGRGWRCCQPTLVGYSLCEHHLGKGRLRSMTSVRSRALGSTTSPTTAQTKKNDAECPHHNNRPLSDSTSLSSTQQESYKSKLEHKANDGDGTGDEDDQKPLMTTKRRMKLGTVKARSISSLLGQTTNNNNEVSTVADNNNQHC